MPSSEPHAFALDRTFVQLDDGPAAKPVSVDADFWARIGERSDLQGGRLVTLSHQGADWPHWEMHPAGDEVVLLLSGAVDLMLELASGPVTVSLRGRSAVIVPQDVWHRGIVREARDMLFVTRGAGTQYRPV